ncbi:hypothetical protein DFR70_105135 [Nocardia tenerifensis]|uniref:HEAT repeat protein n=1 Tax=Nocardia tenerifensis TaxID=228006 RepID=A0A318K5K7_9NOCA|nr:hypothetical protein [Nocardia tenerifensis]PXX63953.1 hypothetical protein DFR70_105135 [Nocardia tenerifensis]
MAAPATKLVKDIEPLSAPQRRRALATVALRLAGTPDLRALLADLAGRGRYERILAMHLAAIAADREHLVSQLDSPEQEFVSRAVVALVRTGVEPAALVERLPRMAQRTRRVLYRAIGRRTRDAALADALLPEVRRLFGEAEAAGILPYCSPSLVAEHLPEFAYTVPNWQTLSRRHSETVLAYLTARADEAGEPDWPELWPRIAAGASAFALREPDRLLALATQAVRFVQLNGLETVAGALARHDPDAVVDLILHPSGRGNCLAGRAVFVALRELPDDRLTAVCAAYPGYHRRRFLHALPPSRRTELVRQVFIRPGVEAAQVDLDALDSLPMPDRTALARELLSRRGGSDDRSARERLIARLSWEEAESVLRESIRRPTADERAEAYPLLVTAAVGSRDPAVLGALLDSLRRLRNEQDPVRRNALQAINRIPPSLLRTEHLPALESLGTDALQARDRSPTTTGAVGALARTLLVHGARVDDAACAESALRLIENLAAQSGSVPLWDVDRDLPRGAEHRLFAALRRRLDADAARDEWGLTLALATGLNKRAWRVPPLQQLLIRACGARNDAVIRAAADLALANPATRDEHLSTLLNRDRSLISLPRVQRLIATRRTDLLDTVLNGATPGRFIAPKVRLVPDFSAGFDGWTPRQIELYARALTAMVRAKESSPWEKTWAIHRLGRLPGSFARLVGYTDHPELRVAEAALTALGRSADAEAAIGVLARHVDTDRARVAVSGMASRARSIAPDRLAGALTPLLDSPKITSLKEGVRLLAALRVPEAMATIQAIWDRPSQHRDVRRAVVFACRWLLDHDEAWKILAEAVTDPAVADEVLSLAPALLPIPQRHRMAALVREMAGGADVQLATEAMRVLAAWQRWAPADTGDMLVRRLADLGEAGLWRQVARVLVGSGFRAEVPSAVDRLLAAEDVVIPGRDLPARQRLSTLLGHLCAAAGQSDEARATAVVVAERLAGETQWRRFAIDLLLTQIRWADPGSSVRAIQQACGLARGALVVYPAEQLRTQLARTGQMVEAAAMTTVARELSTDVDSATALAALALIAQCGNHCGWTATWVELLARMRTHGQSNVRVAAHEIFTVAE